MKNIFKNNSGMTLIELLVSISIIAIMSSVFMVNIRSYNRSGDLISAAHQLANDIRLMQNYALGLKEFDFGSGNGLELPPNGWGIYLKSAGTADDYTLFAADSTNQIFNANAGEEYITNKLPKNIEISSLSSGNFAHLTYRPPDPTVSICRGQNQCAYNDLLITLIDTRSSKTITIYANKYGLIDIN